MVSLFLVLLAAVPAIAVPKEIHYDHARRDNENPDRIIRGVPASIEEFPFLVLINFIYVNNIGITPFITRCGGTIITVNWVLTAAHCLESDNSSRLVETRVRGGSSHMLTGGVERYGTKQVSNSLPTHDIGLIKVDEPWPLNGITISLARLPRQDDPVPVGSPATIMGWGGTDMEGTPPEMLMKAEVRVISHVSCWFHYSWTIRSITKDDICTFFGAGETPSQAWKQIDASFEHDFVPGRVGVIGAFQEEHEDGRGFDAFTIMNFVVSEGDSGSPVLVNGEVAGIVSSRTNLPGRVLPDVHTRVSSYIDWIEENVGPLPRDM